MLAELRIHNLAVVEDLEIGFEAGFNVITGETGAGKTILMRAIGLVLGDRGTVDLVRDGAAEAEVEAVFAGPAITAAFATDGDGEAVANEAIVRRVIAASGRQRAFLNDRLVTAARLATLGEQLVHVYGQHEHHTLLRPDSQREILDATADHAVLVSTMAERYRDLVESEARLEAAQAGAEGAAARRELLGYQVQELTRAGAQAGELEELEREREVLRHAERLRALAADAEQALYAGGGAVLDTVTRLASRLAAVGEIDPTLSEAAQLLEEARPALEEAALRAGGRARAIVADPERLERIEERIALLRRLAQKYGCAPGELPDRLRRAERELSELEGPGVDPAALEQAAAATADAAWRAADALSVARTTAAQALGKRVTAGLAELALAGARLTAALEPLAATDATPPLHARGGRALTANGAERVSFLFAPNPGEAPRPLARIASGGELSRLMLAIKTATARVMDVPTLLFDEVDAGIGGAVAEAVGRRLAQLGATRQVICITHLPQIAACADHHFVVRKRASGSRTRSSAQCLSGPERIEEVARMLAGATITKEARRHAAELCRLGRRGVPDRAGQS